MAKNPEFYQGRRQKRNYWLIPFILLLGLITLMIVLFYGMQKYAIISDDGVTVASVMESVTSAIFSPGEKTSEALETLGKMSENSDFAPLVNLISEMNSEGSMMFILISAQHMPSTYMNMLGMLK